MLGLTLWLFLVSSHWHQVDEIIFSLFADTLRVRGGQATNECDLRVLSHTEGVIPGAATP